jgi:hypothetical protein
MEHIATALARCTALLKRSEPSTGDAPAQAANAFETTQPGYFMPGVDLEAGDARS